MCLLRFTWLICIYLFMSLVRIASFLIVKYSCVREELTDLPIFLQTQLQQITVKEHFWPFSSEQKLWKSSYGIIKKSRKKNDPNIWNGKILRTFGPYSFWPKPLKSVKISYIYYLSFIFLTFFAHILDLCSPMTKLY